MWELWATGPVLPPGGPCLFITETMPFRYKKKKEHGQTTEAQMLQAVRDVLNGKSQRATAKAYGIPWSTLQRYVNKAVEKAVGAVRLVPNYDNARVFTDAQESDL